MEAAPEKTQKSNPAASLTEDLLVEILRRLPVRSVCRFKCISHSWYKLISNPDHRVPQTLAGFFYDSSNGERFPSRAHHFTNITGKSAPFIYPSFSFMPVPSEDVFVIDSCNGFLLCRCNERGPHDGEGFPFHYVVCNPATKKWLMLPDSSRAVDEARTAFLGFDPTVSSHFHVIEYVLGEDECVMGVEIYSSKTAAWSFKESKWGDDVMLYDTTPWSTSTGVFLNSSMHMLTHAVGLSLWIWKGRHGEKFLCEVVILAPSIKQGRLCLLNVDSHKVSHISIWILEDYATNKWTLKHTVSTLQLFRQKNIRFDYPCGYKVIAVHPECNLIFFVFGWDQTLVTYDMDRKEVRVVRKLGRDCTHPYLPYVPLFLESLAE